MKFLNGVGCIVLLLLVQIGWAQPNVNDLARISTDYQQFNLNPSNVPEKWEDGMRTTGGKDTYEWWYFDAHLDDGSKVVIIFYTKEFTRIKKPLSPVIRVTINRPDGSVIQKDLEFKAESFKAAKDSCSVVIGKNYFRGNLKNYEIHVEDEGFDLTATLQRTTQSWRPKTGHILFGEAGEQQFNWVVAVPQGEVALNYTYNSEVVSALGSGYHDHNWGNVGMTDLFNHWYWARAEIGPYNIIAAEMVSTKAFKHDEVMVFNLSKDGKTVADAGEHVTLYRTVAKMHPTLKKDISDQLVFIYDHPEDDYRYEYYLHRQENLLGSMGTSSRRQRLGLWLGPLAHGV